MVDNGNGLMERFKMLNPDDPKPGIWALEIADINDNHLKEMVFAKLAFDCELNPPDYKNITNEAVYSLLDLEDNGRYLLHALIRHKFYIITEQIKTTLIKHLGSYNSQLVIDLESIFHSNIKPK
jgi:hypothetical protein